MTVRFKNELVRNITIKLGYANAKVGSPCPLDLSSSLIPYPRFTSVKTRHAHAQAATGHTGQTKKITHRASARGVVTV